MENLKIKKQPLKQKPDVLIIDNYDSFTFNLAQCIGNFGKNIEVFRNDKISIEGIEELSPLKIIISPGPGRPVDAGISNDVIRYFCTKIPILGVCLGHQCIGEVFGGRIINSGKVIHGKTSLIYHDGKTIFKNIENPFTAARYHSLIIEKKSVPSSFEITAHTDDGIVMGIRHSKYNIEGVQFHPESFLTPAGEKILKNFINL
ncbi:MAG: aminodeoxychorismate/anthranilate synthase component II [Actinobacteria bacterium]|nr:aminodeoxychorismate/anthranilate synthase component II [Actinomycetota bacterium]